MRIWRLTRTTIAYILKTLISLIVEQEDKGLYYRVKSLEY